MAIKAGNILHVGNDTTLIQRLQSGGPGQLDIPKDTVFELGNYLSVGQILGIPNLSFSMESFDVSCAVEALLLDTTSTPVTKVVTNVARAAGVDTFTVTAHGYLAGQTVTISGLTNDPVGSLTSSFNGTYVVLASGLTANTFNVTDTAPSGQTATVTSTAATGTTPTAAPQLRFDLAQAIPLNVKSPFKNGSDDASPFATVGSAGIPYLSLESMSYKFGTSDNATQTATLKGDAVYYNQGSTYVQSVAGTNVASQVIVTTNEAYAITEGGVQRRILCVQAGNKRLNLGTDYTEAYGAVTGGHATTTLTIIAAVPTTKKIRIMYASNTVETFLQAVHTSATILPAAIRGRDIKLYLGGYDPQAPSTNAISGVQSVNIDWKVTLQQDEEFGNYHYVAQDYDVPTVDGSVVIRPADWAAFLARVKQVAGVASATDSVGSLSQPVIAIDVVIFDPNSTQGAVLKRWNLPDSRFTIPGFSARVQQKLDITLNFQSDTGQMIVSNV